MIIARLIGGNGNQMFQYAAGFALAKKHGVELRLDINYLLDKSKRYYRHAHRSYALDMFGVSAEIATDKEIACFTVPRKGNKFFYHLKKRIFTKNNVYREEDFSAESAFNAIPSDAYIEGYWENPGYFARIEQDLRREFSFKRPLPEECDGIKQKIATGDSVCVVFRRGDFVGHPILNIVGLDYYEKALTLLAEKVSDPSIFVFSDDIAWCRENYRPGGYGCEYVNQSLTGPNAEYYLQMMASCKHFIIPNSTFGWWGAWLSNYPGKKVIAPKVWFRGQKDEVNEIVPDEWMTL
ncbi:hypothetical protein CHL67_02555 [Prosthecochloris sp. GSB1]|uniref:alpha-1,2-fucosyltransferase n=1 Tax=Prosthecochloris sp. GSB1 TaxID=281093 RepID=UPI000B8CA448|nr:alpha-1,2-fucosyltransferase [Prosthecochloris sp. GSB1]ASQ89949.1 hypothetical protein CHL67_02555 [Prosthecochloris sp. GSB1]